MSMRFRWVLNSVAVSIIVVLLVYYMFSLAFSINTRENGMINTLATYKDTSFDPPGGPGDEIWLAAVGSLITLFAGGMAAALLSRVEKSSDYKLLATSAIVALFTAIAIDAFIYISWDRGMQAYMAAQAGYGPPIEPTPFIVALFLMLLLDGVCFMASAMGGVL